MFMIFIYIDVVVAVVCRKAAIGVYSASFIEAEAISEKPGTWLISCMNSEHFRSKYITCLFAYCKGGNFNIHIWVWLGYFICVGRGIRFYL